MPFLPPNQQHQSTEGKPTQALHKNCLWRHTDAKPRYAACSVVNSKCRITNRSEWCSRWRQGSARERDSSASRCRRHLTHPATAPLHYTHPQFTYTNNSASILVGSQHGRCPLLLSIDGTDRQMDTVPLYTGWGKKRGHRVMTVILSNLNRFTEFFPLEDSLVNLQLNGY